MNNLVQKPHMFDAIITEVEFRKLIKAKNVQKVSVNTMVFSTGGEGRHKRILEVKIDPELQAVTKAVYSTAKNTKEVNLNPVQEFKVYSEIRAREVKKLKTLITEYDKANKKLVKEMSNLVFARLVE